jgi:hypothetical protein
MKIIACQKFKLKTREYIPYTTEIDDALMATIIKLCLWQKRGKKKIEVYLLPTGGSSPHNPARASTA